MEKFLIWLACVFVIIIGAPNVVTCVEYIFDRTGVIGSPNQLEKEELQDNCQGYTITYNLDGGTLAADNPETYNLFTVDFTLKNPTKDKYAFCGWTGSNGTTPQLKVTICTGSSGNLEFTANYVPILDTPTVSINDTLISWNAIENADAYEITINNTAYEIANTVTEVDLSIYKASLIDGQNAIKIRACSKGVIDTSSEYSNVVYYSATQLTMPYITIEGTNVSWTASTNADYYAVKISEVNSSSKIAEFTTSDISFNLNNYSGALANDTKYFIWITACSNQTEYIDSRTTAEMYTHQSTMATTNLTEISSKNKVTLIDKLENGEHIGILTLDLVDIDGNVWQFRTAGTMYDTYSECEDEFTIYKLNLETNEFEKTYTKYADQIEFFNNTKFYFGNNQYFKFYNYEPSIYENTVYCFARYFANYFVARADERIDRTTALEYANSYECTEEYTYTDYAWEVFTLIKVYSNETNEQITIEDDFKIEVTDYGVI